MMAFDAWVDGMPILLILLLKFVVWRWEGSYKARVLTKKFSLWQNPYLSSYVTSVIKDLHASVTPKANMI